jgi:PDZ domain-containing protein
MKKVEPGVKSNYQEALAAAKKLNTKMKIVPVKTVQDAIDYLKE